MADIRDIKSGLFLYECEDYHAILGLPVDASPDIIRQRYIAVTRLLHPDRRRLASPDDESLADRLLAKFVNPAYEVLYKNKSQRSDHKLIVEATVTRMAAEGGVPPLKNDTARQLSTTQGTADLEVQYRSTLKNLSARLYEDVSTAPALVGELSELNMVYLVRKALSGEPTAPTRPAGAAPPPPTSRPPAATASAPNGSSSGNGSGSAPPTTPPPAATEGSKKAAMIEPYLKRARTSLKEKNFSQAILELRDALALDNKSAACHALLGYAYLQQRQMGMSRVHTRKALQLDPKEQTAVVTQKALDKNSSGQGQSNKKKSESKGGGGFLGGLFGRGKK